MIGQDMRKLQMAQEAVYADPVVTITSITEMTQDMDKVLTDILALLDSGQVPSCAAPHPEVAQAELPEIVRDRLERLKDMHLDIGNKLLRVRDIILRLRDTLS